MPETESENQHEKNLKVLSSFDLTITTSIMQSDNESISVNKNGQRGSIDLAVSDRQNEACRKATAGILPRNSSTE